MNIEWVDYILFNSYEQYGYICVRSYNESIFIRIGSNGCEMENLHTGKRLNVIGVDAT
jgi:hypothetical protein